MAGEAKAAHSRYGCNVVAFDGDAAEVMSYLTSYFTKCVGDDVEMGRRWGVWGDLTQEIICAARLNTRRDLVEFLRRIRRWARNRPVLRKVNERWHGWAAFGDGGPLCKLLHGLTDYRVAAIVGVIPP